MKFPKSLVLFIIGGGIYVCLELIWRGYSHWTMFILGGLCFLCIGAINNEFNWDMPFVLQCITGGCIVTTLEFFAGILLNIILKLNVWDYSNMPGNVLGQICPQFFLLWIVISGIAIVLDDYIRYWFWGEEKPHYHFI